MQNKAFTLIELLIVVAIIAILAAIAVPNFLEAQTRAKISRAKADMRSISTGLESYKIDTNKYPLMTPNAWSLTFGSSHPDMPPTLERLTTPIAYLTSGQSFVDPFIGEKQYHGRDIESVQIIDDRLVAAGLTKDKANPHRLYRYNARGVRNAAIWNRTEETTYYLLESCGPDKHYHRMGDPLNVADSAIPGQKMILSKALYDPTNGTVSRGSIWRAGGGTGRGDFFVSMIPQ